jgi:hypothetical protein
VKTASSDDGLCTLVENADGLSGLAAGTLKLVRYLAGPQTVACICVSAPVCAHVY